MIRDQDALNVVIDNPDVFQRLKRIAFEGKNTREWHDDVDALNQLPDLETAVISLTTVNQSDIDIISEWSNLHTLVFFKCMDRVNAELSPLRRLKLKEIMFYQTPLKDAATPALCKMSTLQRLFMVETEMTASAVEQIRAELPDCEIVADTK